ncbi:nuclease EXOG, mitochondrial-like [Asterias amurensis]|uniref:nuclease EXOG, mitochondrial-like n=1 Tax=Asterias amurensis TaxID=7602 RepID=UPI003AB89813
MAARLFSGGFATGAATSFALYSIFAYVVKPEPEYKKEGAPQKLKDVKLKDLLKYGVPEKGPDVRYYSNHALSYDQAKKIPLWVAEHLTQNELKGPANRKHSNFKMDPNINSMFSSHNSDYLRSGWSRGHMAPAGDNKHSQAAMDESFYLSNIVPQDLDNNRDFWNRLEIYCRDLTKTYKDVWVLSGPLILPNIEEDGKKYVKYQVIGKNNVAVPTHLYKLITIAVPPDENNNQENAETLAVGAFIVPNKPIHSNRRLQDFQVPVKNLSESSGLGFFSELGSDAKFQNLCDVDSCNLMSQEKMELYFIGRRLENATTIHRLEESWKELEKRKLKPDEYLKEAYKRKRTEIEEKDKQKEAHSEL